MQHEPLIIPQYVFRNKHSQINQAPKTISASKAHVKKHAKIYAEKVKNYIINIYNQTIEKFNDLTTKMTYKSYNL